jgi:hypothetical protein
MSQNLKGPFRGTALLSASSLVCYGAFLTREELTASYVIICYNIRTYHSAGVVAVVSGRHNAESELKKFEDSQGSSDHHEGWRYLIDRTDLKAGTEPAEATRHRQAELEARESKALKEIKTPLLFSETLRSEPPRQSRNCRSRS